ncbi:MAG: MinD/ParA family ATP-binding protein [Egibacteraceae bacterium]
MTGSAFSFTDPPCWHVAAHRVERGDPVKIIRPASPWKRLLRWSGLSGDRPSHAQLHNRRLTAMLTRPLQDTRAIAMISAKGGVGTTSTTVNLGHVFAGFRTAPVIALDADPQGANLAYRVPRQTRSTIFDLLGDLPDDVESVNVRDYTCQAPSGLEVLASPPDPELACMLGLDDYRRVIELLRGRYELVLADCATVVPDKASPTVAVAADQLVIASHPTIDATRATSLMLARLGAQGHGQLVNDAVLVLNAVGPRVGSVDLAKIERHFAPQVRQVVRIPWDPHLQAGARARLEDLRPDTRRAYLVLAAAVAGGFPRAARTQGHV